MSGLNRQPTLVGPTLTLSALEPGDFDALYSCANDPELWAQHPQPDRWKREVFERFFADGLASGGALKAVQTLTGRVIGTSRFHIEGWPADVVEIGWTFVARDLWRSGANREMKRLMLGHAISQVREVVFSIGQNNQRSRTAVEAIGARLEVGASHRPGSVVYRLDRDGMAAFLARA